MNFCTQYDSTFEMFQVALLHVDRNFVKGEIFIVAESRLYWPLQSW